METPKEQYERALRGEFKIGDWVQNKDLSIFMGKVKAIGTMGRGIPALRVQGLLTEFLLPISQAVMLGFGKYWEAKADE